MKKKLLISLAILALMGSCTDLDDILYDRIPADLYPENEIQGAIETIPVYTPLRDFIDWGGWWFCQELTSDEMVGPTRHTDWDDGGKWRVLHQHTWTNTTEAISSMWSRYYNGIGEANRLIEKFEPGADLPGPAATVAKLKIMRAYYYYLLIDNYGDVPYVTNFAEAEENPSKTNMADIFLGIVADIESSIPFLTESTSKTAVTRGMAFSLLAKLYLNAGIYTGTLEWAAAEEACDSVIALGMYSLESDPLGPFVEENETSSENIFTIPYDEDTYTGFNLHMRTLHYISNQTFDMSAGPWNGFAVMEDHYDTYEDNDLRKKNGFLIGQQYSITGAALFDLTAGSNLIFDKHIPALLMDASYTFEEIRMSGARVVKFEVAKGAKGDVSNDFPLFRYADILLMKAEAIIRQMGGPDAEADDLVNEIRDRAEIGDLTNVDLATLLEVRGREMFYEGHRRQDLIRFGEFNKAWWEKSVSGTDRNTFPIPQWAIDANPNLAK